MWQEKGVQEGTGWLPGVGGSLLEQQVQHKGAGHRPGRVGRKAWRPLAICASAFAPWDGLPATAWGLDQVCRPLPSSVRVSVWMRSPRGRKSDRDRWEAARILPSQVRAGLSTGEGGSRCWQEWG